MSSPSTEATINFPQIIVLTILLLLGARWYFSSSTSANSNPSSRSSNTTQSRASIAQVDQISAMFPQLDRRHVMWDLHRNGGNVAATTERILGGRGLEIPPPSFQPPQLNPTVPAAANPSSTSTTTPIKPQHPDLITRYKLSDKLNSPSPSPSASEPSTPEAIGTSSSTKSKNAWSANKADRQALLQRRREEMILNARRKMEEKERSEKGKAAA